MSVIRVAPGPFLVPVPDLAAKFGAKPVSDAIERGFPQFLQRLGLEGLLGLSVVTSIDASSKRLGRRHRDGGFISLDDEGNGLRGACREGHCGHYG